MTLEYRGHVIYPRIRAEILAPGASDPLPVDTVEEAGRIAQSFFNIAHHVEGLMLPVVSFRARTSLLEGGRSVAEEDIVLSMAVPEGDVESLEMALHRGHWTDVLCEWADWHIDNPNGGGGVDVVG